MFVYMILNQENGKIYVGKTVTKDLEKYLRDKLSSARTGRYNGRSYLFNAMQKYSPYVWKIFPLISILTTNKDLCFWERVLIAQYDSQNPDVGYNLCDGGQGRSDRGWHHTAEGKKNISLGNKGKHRERLASPTNQAARSAGFQQALDIRGGTFQTAGSVVKIKTARSLQDESKRLAAHKAAEQLHGVEWIQQRAASHRGKKHNMTEAGRQAQRAAQLRGAAKRLGKVQNVSSEGRRSHRERARRTSHIRWHVARGIQSSNCSYCKGESS